MLLGACHECIGGGEDFLQDFLGPQTVAGLNRVHQAVLAPLFIGMVHRFADAIRVGHENIARSERD